MRTPRPVLVQVACVAVVAATAVLWPAATTSAVGVSPPILDAYTVTVEDDQLADMLAAGRDIGSVSERPDGRYDVEVVLTAAEAEALERDGAAVALWRSARGYTLAQEARLDQEDGYEVFRSFDEDGGIRDELYQLAEDHPELVKLEVIGTSVQDRPIIALKITKDAGAVEDGARPQVLFSSLQHAREWIAVEVNRRLAHYLVDNYGTDDRVTRLLDGTEVWFVIMANPDGYEFTFGPERLWRKNMRDIEGDGEITGREGVDLNRNFDAHWNFDADGSSSNPYSDVYRGPEPASEPETQALQALLLEHDFVFQVNYHSAAELLLYGTGWQDLTWTPDDIVQQALSGDVFAPAVDGFWPMRGSELYITNGETCDFAHSKAGTPCWTPELTRGGIPGESGFVFPDDEAAIQAEFDKNLPFALDVIASAHTPETPVSHLGNETRPLVAHEFELSYGSLQTVAGAARRSLGDVTLHYRVNDGPTESAAAAEWDGGARYGADGDVLYRAVRGAVPVAAGDVVEAWFAADGEESESFTFTGVETGDGNVLVVAAEDYTGITPEYEEPEARYVDLYVAALEGAGYEADVYDVDAHGAPSALGVLAHYDAVVWYTGDDLVPRVEGMEGGEVSKVAADTMLAMRDYLNEGGKLLHAGRQVARAFFSGLEYDSNGDQGCIDDEAPAGSCSTTLQNDFYQYWLGVDGLGVDAGITSGGDVFDVRLSEPFEGLEITFSSPVTEEHAAALVPTSARMAEDTYPLFASRAAASFERPGDKPHGGEHVVYSGETSWTYQRLMRTLDLSAVPTTTMSLWLSYDVRDPWDAVFIEAHTPGEDDWTTLPDLNGNTSPAAGASHCRSRNFTVNYPHLGHYMSRLEEDQDVTCVPTGSTGEWHPANGSSRGEWQEWRVDLAPWEGGAVEVAVSFLSSRVAYPGVLIDDITLPDGETTGFEDGLGGWSVAGPPDDVEPPETDWAVVGADEMPKPAGGPIVVTPRSVTLGFDLSSVAVVEERTALLERALAHLGLEPPAPPELYLPVAHNREP